MPSFVSIDVETANNDPSSICQIGMARFENGEMVACYCRLINPDTHFNGMNIQVHGIKPEDVARAPKFFEVYDEVNEWLNAGIVTSHSYFDRGAIYGAIKTNLCPQNSYNWLDATTIIRRTWPQYSKRGYGLGNLANDFEIEFQHHDAFEDARVSGLLLCRALADSGRTIHEWHKIIKPKHKSS